MSDYDKAAAMIFGAEYALFVLFLAGWAVSLCLEHRKKWGKR